MSSRTGFPGAVPVGTVEASNSGFCGLLITSHVNLAKASSAWALLLTKTPQSATDKYTIRLPNGERNLVFEDTLAQVQTHFVAVLAKVQKRQRLSATDRARLCVFAAAMHSRTTAMGEHWKKQQRQLHEQIVALEQSHNAPPSLSLETGQYAELAHQHLIATALELEAPLLFQMRMTILVTDDDIGCLTSDTPCVWCNPNLYKFPPFYRSPGLAQNDIEVTLPLTPQHLVTISHHEYPQYVDVAQKAVDEFNRRARFHCAEEFVSRNGDTRPYWFDPGKEPEDTWEKSEEGKRALASQDRPSKDDSETG
ncbi:MAG: DUF4238 domain-containing protein [Candidatus Acidiferrum sp.]